VKAAVIHLFNNLARSWVRGAERRSAESDPFLQPLWRRLLGLRVLALLPIVAWLFQLAVDWVDRTRVLNGYPAWVDQTWGIFVGASLVSLLLSTAFALHDTVLCLVPHGPARTILLLGDEESEARQSFVSNEALAWRFLVYPMLAPIALLVLGALALAASGGVDPLLAGIEQVIEAKRHWMALSAGVTTGLLLKR